MLTHSFFWIYIAFFQIVSKAQKRYIYRIFSGYIEHFFLSLKPVLTQSIPSSQLKVTRNVLTKS